MRHPIRSIRWRSAATLVAVTLLALGLTTGEVAGATQTLIPAGATWRYLDTGASPTGWATPGFDDSAWRTGPAQLGAGDGDEATVINRRSPAHLDDYFRTTFTAPPGVTALTVRLVADDGALVYLNGTLVLNDNIAANGYPDYRGSSTGENAFRTFALPTAGLNVGTNTLAVDLRQNYRNDPDSSFDLELTAEVATTTTSSTSTSSTSSTTTSTTSTTTTTTTTTSTSTTTTTTVPAPPVVPAEVVGRPCTPGQAGDTLRYGGTASGGIVTAEVSDGTVVLACAPAPDVVGFVAVGDAGTGDATQQRVAAAMTAWADGRTVDALVESGDNVLPDGSPDRFQTTLVQPYATLRARMPHWVALGNHDLMNGNGDNQIAFLGLPARTHEQVLTRGGVQVQLLFLDSNWTDPTQTAWLESKLTSGDFDHRIAVFHQPPFNCGTAHEPDAGTYDNWRPLLEAHGADLVISGHEHSYQRFAEGGTTFVVAGGGGQELYPLDPACTTPMQASAVAHHFLHVQATGTALHVSVVSDAGAVLDTFTA